MPPNYEGGSVGESIDQERHEDENNEVRPSACPTLVANLAVLRWEMNSRNVPKMLVPLL